MNTVYNNVENQPYDWMREKNIRAARINSANSLTNNNPVE